MRFLAFPLLVIFLFAQDAQAQKALNLDDCFVFFKFYPESGENFQYLKDGLHYAESEGGALHIHNVLDEAKDSTIELNLPDEAKGFDQFEFSEDESKLMLRTETEAVYRHSVLAKYFVYDLKMQKCSPVSADKLQFVAFSPTGKDVAFVRNNNLFIKNLEDGRTHQVTTDGEKNSIINGLPDWVYEEEFSPVDGNGMVATVWSPDGKKLAFIRFDERFVPEIPLTFYEGGNYPRRSTFRYPKVGSPNSNVSVKMFDVETYGMIGTVMGLEKDDYVPKLNWTQDNQLILTRLNRRQDTLELLQALPERVLFDSDDNKNYIPCKLLLSETDRAYVEVESESKLLFLSDKKSFLWASDREGWQHVYRYYALQSDAKAIDLTPGKFDMTAFYGVDERNGKFYFQAATPTPMDRQVWEGDLSGKTPARLLTPRNGSSSAEFSPTFDHYTLSWEDANTPPVVTLCNRKGEVLKTFTDNARVLALRKEYGFSEKTFFKIPIENGVELNAWAIKPPNFNPAIKYPVLFDVYGGPNSQTVQNQYDGYLGSWHQYLAQKGYIIVSVDNRGTGARGRDFRKCTQLQLGKYETEDQIAAARYLGKQSWVDSTRIGIWGWSFGGYLSSSCILKGNDVFKMAMAVAPVTNWKWYDSAYTERYMHTTVDNARGYEDNSPINFAGRLRGDNYLICHGAADDNVHWQQSVEMINALIKANKQFDTYYYPNRNHGIYGDNATRHLFTKLSDFVLEKL